MEEVQRVLLINTKERRLMNIYINEFNGIKKSEDGKHTNEYVVWLESEILSLRSRLSSILEAKHVLQRQVDSYQKKLYDYNQHDAYSGYFDPEEYDR